MINIYGRIVCLVTGWYILKNLSRPEEKIEEMLLLFSLGRALAVRQTDDRVTNGFLTYGSIVY